jgi:hypothetical protein
LLVAEFVAPSGQCGHPEKDEDFMVCDIHGTCFFFNNTRSDMPHTVECLKERYCLGDFYECALYRVAASLGEDLVPHDLYPNDMLETLDLNLPDGFESQGGTAMRIEVIHADGTLGTVRASSLGQMVKAGSIAAYLCSEGWVELRRKLVNGNYSGRERRNPDRQILTTQRL